MTDQTGIDATELKDLAGERAVIRCSCGFLVLGSDEDSNRLAFNGHPCPNRPAEDPEPTHLLGYLFSWPALVIVAVIAYAILVAIGARP